MTARTSHDTAREIPEATVARLPVYLRALTTLSEAGTATCSSEDLAAAAGVNSAKLRKDLSYLGSYGTRGVGYDVDYLRYQIAREIGVTPGLARGHRRHRQPGPRAGELLRLPQPRLPRRRPPRRRPRAPPRGRRGRRRAALQRPDPDRARAGRGDRRDRDAGRRRPGRRRQDGRGRDHQHPQLRPDRAQRRPGRRRPQGRPVHRAPDPGLPRAAQGAQRAARRHDGPRRRASPTAPRRSRCWRGWRSTPTAPPS